jgi:hypothetical protein
MESRFDESWASEFADAGEAESSWEWDESLDESYEAEGESWQDAERSNSRRRQPVRRPSVLRRPGAPGRPAAGRGQTAYLRTPRGTAQLVVPPNPAAEQRLATLHGGVDQLQSRQDNDRADLTQMLRRFQSGNERRFKRQAVATAIAAVAPLAIQILVSRFSTKP